MENRLSDRICIRVTSADIPAAMQALTKANIPISRVAWESDLSIVFLINSSKYAAVNRILNNRGDKCEHLGQWGIVWIVNQLRQRLLLLIAACILLTLTIWIPSRIFFIQVHGNQNVSKEKILQAAANLGIEFGGSRAKIRSEQIKNLMLEAIPELEWIGVTTTGCVASIDVRETIQSKKENTLPGSMIAKSDGIVISVTATQGKALCKPGDVVKLGQVLISGYEDCGLTIRYTGASGEIIAKTYRTVDVKTPLVAIERKTFMREENRYAVKIGKKLINFSKDSGISPSGCVKMYEERYLSLPGGFNLPVSLIHERILYYSTDAIQLPDDAFVWLENYSDMHLRNQMISGTILNKKSDLYYVGDCLVFRGTYYCTEQIGKYKHEEFPNYGKNS